MTSLIFLTSSRAGFWLLKPYTLNVSSQGIAGSFFKAPFKMATTNGKTVGQVVHVKHVLIVLLNILLR